MAPLIPHPVVTFDATRVIASHRPPGSMPTYHPFRSFGPIDGALESTLDGAISLADLARFTSPPTTAGWVDLDLTERAWQLARPGAPLTLTTQAPVRTFRFVIVRRRRNVRRGTVRVWLRSP